jgi:LysM repeat protein
MTWNQAYDRYQEEQSISLSTLEPVRPADSAPFLRLPIGRGAAGTPTLIGGALVLLLALMASFFFPRPQQVTEGSQSAALEERLVALEHQIAALGKIEQGLSRVGEMSNRINERNTRMDELFTRLEDQGRRADKFVARVDALESALIERMVDIATLLDDLQKPGVAPRPSAAATPPATSAPTDGRPANERKSLPRYHTVQAGETLHIIGRRYGLKINDLRRLNRLSASEVLRPGQKLVLSPS